MVSLRTADTGPQTQLLEWSEMARNPSHTFRYYIGVGTQSILYDHIQILPYSCTTNQTPSCSSWLLLANPKLVLHLEYLVILMCRNTLNAGNGYFGSYRPKGINLL